MEEREEDKALASKLLASKLEQTGEEVLSVHRPTKAALQPLLANKGLCGLRAGRAKWNALVESHTLYVLTSKSVYSVLVKEDLAAEAQQDGKRDVSAMPSYARIAFAEMDKALLHDGFVSVSGKRSWVGEPETLDCPDKLVLKWYGAGSEVVVAVQQAHEDCMNSAILDTLPAGALENRVTHN